MNLIHALREKVSHGEKIGCNNKGFITERWILCDGEVIQSVK
jgi:hypothetical protein